MFHNKRKPMRVQSDDESEGESSVPVKRPRIEEEPFASEDEEIDVEGADPPSHAPSRLVRRQSSGSSKRPSKPSAKAPPAKKRKRAAASDAESEDEFFNDAVDSDAFDEPPSEEIDDGDDDFVVDDGPKRGKGKAAAGRSKARLKDDAKTKDDRQKPPPLKRARPTPSLTIDDSASQASGDTLASAAPETAGGAVSLKALPRIKKNKSTASTAPGTPGTPAAAKGSGTKAGAPPTKAALDLSKDLGIRANSRKAAANAPASDLNLMNKDIYSSLFKGGAGPPRAGVKVDDGRKELMKKRDEERAKRQESLRHTFDLQAQTEKIIHFEHRLRAQGNGVLYPNFLAAKWRDVYERDKREREQQARSDSGGGTPGERRQFS
ncbi:hypothetical protein BD626DRAFT_182101 [Schizophyllum amplum]|uniref:Uncharacterized protein n=1 Tax=Schizophyllum amplum TaxID=97359 RepID=A0A550C1L9_9AGAR|nr:hypothetical protein BD626DRAFT_182101 [Auriculariopsis ampla]